MTGSSINSFKDLNVWRAGVELGVECYGIADRLPPLERFGIGIQLRRAAVSVTANIAEGNGRWHRRDYVRFLSIANGSLSEVENYLHLCCRLGYTSDEDA